MMNKKELLCFMENDFHGRILLKKGVEILRIKKRMGFACLFSINEYKVNLEYQEKIYSFNCWASIGSPNKSNLFFSILEKINEMEKIPIEEDLEYNTR